MAKQTSNAWQPWQTRNSTWSFDVFCLNELRNTTMPKFGNWQVPSLEIPYLEVHCWHRSLEGHRDNFKLAFTSWGELKNWRLCLKPGTGNPGTRNRELEPGTGNREPGTGNREPESGKGNAKIGKLIRTKPNYWIFEDFFLGFRLIMKPIICLIYLLVTDVNG